MNNNNTIKADVFQPKKKIPPKKPPRLSITRKAGSHPVLTQNEQSLKKGVCTFFNEKSAFVDNQSRVQLDSTSDSTGSGTYEEIGQILLDEDEKIEELDIAVIEEEASAPIEHVYESISDHVATKNNSSQTDDCSDHFQHPSFDVEDLRVFRETSCQTVRFSASPEKPIRRNKKRNSDSREEDLATLGKTKECRLNSESSTSTQGSRDSADSGHFSVQVSNSECTPSKLEHSENDDARYLWQPEGLSQEEVKSFMDSLPADKVPSAFTPEGVVYFNEQLAHQNPKQDADPSLCHSLSKDQAIALKSLYENCLGKARGTAYIQITDGCDYTCKSCGESFDKKDMVVSAGGAFRHPSCFTCVVCREFLTKLIYYSDGNNRLFCGRHYAELFKPRCFHCDELIISGKVVQAMGHAWHAQHFCCAKCSKNITETTYTTEEDKPICLSCHATHLADKCEGCGQKITIGQKCVSHGNKHWHDECFICEKCEDTLVLGNFNFGGKKAVCMGCFQQAKSKLCCKCGDEIKVGSQLVDYNNQYYHGKCFCCKSCDQPITSGYVEHGDSFYCPSCHQDLFSQKCTQCGRPVLGNGVAYNDQVWHDSCFDCFNCQKPIASHKFLLRYDQRYCSGCYEKLFAKRCHSCSQLIKDGAYLTSNDLFWHNECFRCAACQKDLESIGFHMVESKTYCSECP